MSRSERALVGLIWLVSVVTIGVSLVVGMAKEWTEARSDRSDEQGSNGQDLSSRGRNDLAITSSAVLAGGEVLDTVKAGLLSDHSVPHNSPGLLGFDPTGPEASSPPDDRAARATLLARGGSVSGAGPRVRSRSDPEGGGELAGEGDAAALPSFADEARAAMAQLGPDSRRRATRFPGDSIRVMEEPSVTPYWCENPPDEFGLPIRQCGISFVLVRDPRSCLPPSRLVIGLVVREGGQQQQELRPESWYVARGFHRFFVDWNGQKRGDVDRSGVVDVDDLLAVVNANEYPMPGSDVCPELCPDGVVDIQDLMAVLGAFSGSGPAGAGFACGW